MNLCSTLVSSRANLFLSGLQLIQGNVLETPRNQLSGNPGKHTSYFIYIVYKVGILKGTVCLHEKKKLDPVMFTRAVLSE